MQSESDTKDDDDTSTASAETEKFKLFLDEFQNRSALDAKINQLLRLEFEDRIQSILIINEKDFLASILDGIKMSIEATYSIDVFNHKGMKAILRQCDSNAKKEFQRNFTILSTAWGEYEASLKASNKAQNKIKKYSGGDQKYSGGDKNFSGGDKKFSGGDKNFSFLKNYRKHCRFTSSWAMHTCLENSKLLEVFDDDANTDTNTSIVTHLICTECKKCFFSDQILLYCAHCKTDFYSEVLKPGEDVDMLPATWEKYHCSALVNDRMKCIKCREIFFLNLKSGVLTCQNPKCNFEAMPLSIAWNCAMCRTEFKSEAKIYNPMEFNAIKKAIRQALQLKLKAKPAVVPCCKINVYTRTFYHKKECKGILLQGEYNNQLIVVCEKCHSMNFYDKYVWMCPKCNVRFKHVVSEEEHEDPRKITRSGAILDKEKNEHISKEITDERSGQCIRSSMQLYSKAVKQLQSQDGEENESSSSPYRKSKNLQISKAQSEGNYNYSSNIKESDLNDEPKGNSPVRSKARPKTLFEILSQRKSEKRLSLAQSLSEEPREKNDQSKSEVTIEVVQEEPQEIKQPEPEPEVVVSTPQAEATVSTESKAEDDEAIPQTSAELTQDQINSLRKSFNTRKINEFDFDEYKVIKLIGEGSYGKIYQIENIKSGRQYAMKKLIAHIPEEVAVFKQEFELVNTMKHRNIMKIYGMTIKILDLTTYAVYILMELATYDWDKEIKQRLDCKKPYSEDELLNIVKQLTAALAFLQKLSVSHRDLKPQNVLVFDNGVYKLADFGEAKEVKISKQLNTLRGTDIYMSPILFEGVKKNLDDVTHNSYKSDVFSLGICLLYASTLNFNVIYEIRDLRDMNVISTILNKYLKTRYTSKLINLLIKMLDADEQTRCDLIALERYIKETC